jgi:hypothetical protein
MEEKYKMPVFHANRSGEGWTEDRGDGKDLDPAVWQVRDYTKYRKRAVACPRCGRNGLKSIRTNSSHVFQEYQHVSAFETRGLEMRSLDYCKLKEPITTTTDEV